MHLEIEMLTYSTLRFDAVSASTEIERLEGVDSGLGSNRPNCGSGQLRPIPDIGAGHDSVHSLHTIVSNRARGVWRNPRGTRVAARQSTMPPMGVQYSTMNTTL